MGVGTLLEVVAEAVRGGGELLSDEAARLQQPTGNAAVPYGRAGRKPQKQLVSHSPQPAGTVAAPRRGAAESGAVSPEMAQLVRERLGPHTSFENGRDAQLVEAPVRRPRSRGSAPGEKVWGLSWTGSGSAGRAARQCASELSNGSLSAR